VIIYDFGDCGFGCGNKVIMGIEGRVG